LVSKISEQFLITKPGMSLYLMELKTKFEIATKEKEDSGQGLFYTE
jgi:hypothetical protein